MRAPASLITIHTIQFGFGILIMTLFRFGFFVAIFKLALNEMKSYVQSSTNWLVDV